MSIHAADALMGIFGFKRVADDEITLDNPPPLDDDSGSLDEGTKMEEVKNEGLEVVAWQFKGNGKWYLGSNTNGHKSNTISAGYPVRELCLFDKALAGYAVRDARIAELELPYTKMCERMWELESERDQLRAELAELKTQLDDGTTGNKADMYEEVWHAAKAMGYGNVTGALNELAAIKAQEPAGWTVRGPDGRLYLSDYAAEDQDEADLWPSTLIEGFTVVRVYAEPVSEA